MLQNGSDCCVRPKRAKPRSCTHLADALKSSDGRAALMRALQRARDVEVGASCASQLCACVQCGERGGWAHLCVECGVVACFRKHAHESSLQRHVRQHLSQSGHVLAVSLVSPGSVYCNECCDYVYNDAFEHLSRLTRAAAVTATLKSSTPFVMWTPLQRDQLALSQNAVKLAAPPHFAGLRGLLNLGSTCFLNAIMQAGFVHNPIVRNFFLSDLHNSAACKSASCLMCQVDRFMSEMFSCEPQPFACHQFLFAMWQHSDYLAGYEQQDAHEFLISLFNGLHSSSRSLDQAVLPSRCACVVHQTFGSTLRSECTCSSCGYVSTSLEPALDISLEIPEDLRREGAPPCLLENCLAGFTNSEVLGDDDRLKCEKCGSLQQARKQMSLESPPVVLCLQIKRFQRTMGTRKMVSSKIETQVQFPSELDLIPYLSSSVVGKNHQQGTSKKRAQSISYVYDLFAVINHHGSLDNGHYTCYVQQQMGGGSHNEWVKCDDAVLTRVSAGEVHASQCYILFYCKRFIEYN